MRFSIRSKLFILLAGLVAVVLAGVLTSVSRTLTAAIYGKVKFDFEESERTFSREQSLHYINLLTAADLIGENSSFIATASSIVPLMPTTSSSCFPVSRPSICSSSPTVQVGFWPGSAIPIVTART